MSGGEFDEITGVVTEDDLVVSGSFLPGAFDNFAVLENGGTTGTDSSDVFVITVGHFAFVDKHGDDDFRSDLGRFAAVGSSARLVEVIWTSICQVFFPVSVAAEVAIILGVVLVNGIVRRNAAEVDTDISGGGSIAGVGTFAIFWVC